MDNQFGNNWTKKEKKNNTFLGLKESLKPQQPLKPKMELAKNKVQIQNKKLDAMLDKLKSREKMYFDQIVTSLQKHDSQHGKMISTELAQVRKTEKTMSQLKLALEQVQMRLESTIDMGDSMAALGPAMGALSQIKSKINIVLPDADNELTDINNAFNDILNNASEIGNNTFDYNNSNEEVRKILAEANFIAEQRTSIDIPDIPGDRINHKSNPFKERTQ